MENNIKESIKLLENNGYAYVGEQYCPRCGQKLDRRE